MAMLPCITEEDEVELSETLETPEAEAAAAEEAVSVAAAVEEPAAAEPAVQEPAPPAAEVPDPQLVFEKRKHAIEERIGKLCMEEQQLKTRIKVNRELLRETAEELEKHILRGVIVPVVTEIQDEDAASDTEEENMPPRAVDGLKVYLLKTFRSDDLTFGVKGTFVTAYRDADDDLFLAQFVGLEEEPDEDGWAINYIGSDECELRTEPPEGPDAWRETTVEELGLSDSLCGILREHNGISTLGGIADFCTSGRTVQDLKKIGEAKAAKIEEAMDRYWAEHPRT